jgi:hypothetical protein
MLHFQSDALDQGHVGSEALILPWPRHMDIVADS